MKLFLPAALALPLLLAQTPTSPTSQNRENVNPEILKLVIYDQWDRGNDMLGNGQLKPEATINWEEVGKRDQERRDSVRKLLADGQLRSAKDYRFASLIFQHSTDAAGYLLAHVLAETAVRKGDSYSKWLAASTLDRYLQSLNQPQVFGTQFHQSESGWTMEPYNRAVFSDSIRAEWCVVPLAEQEQSIRDTREGKALRGTNIKDCN